MTDDEMVGLKKLVGEVGAMEMVRRNNEEYGNLINRRLVDLQIPKEDRAMTEYEFVKEERRLEKRGVLLREMAGISNNGEAVYCYECQTLFSVTKLSSLRSSVAMLNIEECEYHKKHASHFHKLETQWERKNGKGGRFFKEENCESEQGS